MRLRYSPTSPYVRKVSVSAIELGLADRIDRILTDTRDPSSGLSDDNPLGKVPALVVEEGEVLYDSPVICLDSLHDGPKLFPPAGPERWRALRQQALGDGILDAAVLRLIETQQRPAERRWPDWTASQRGKIARALDRFESEAEFLEGALTIGQISVGCALGYLDFRFAEDEWRKTRPRLAEWYGVFARRPSLVETVPHPPR